MMKNSNCTVSRVYMAQQLAKLFALAEGYVPPPNATIQVEENTVAKEDLISLLGQFSRCIEDDALFVEVPRPTFIQLWQLITTYTCYTCGLVYGIGGFILAYRMNKFKVSRPYSFGYVILITLASLVVGAVIGFMTGALPAALISQIYAAIPHNLQPEAAISLGVAQAIIIIYFDLGRAVRRLD